ncbi:MAG: ATP-binding protein [Pseudomonadota bacterium]
MRLRTQILVFLFLFALTPLLLLTAINMPLVLGSVEEFYHTAHLQNLRADFRDLDQHIASRQEMVRILAKLPEPGSVLATEDQSSEKIDEARARYVEWINHLFDDQRDVTRVVFTDADGKPKFWLQRDAQTALMQPTLDLPPSLPEQYLESSLGMQPRTVMVSPIRVNPGASPFDFLTLNLASSFVLQPGQGNGGLVYITLDVGGMANSYRNTFWVHGDGRYLQPGELASGGESAFEDFPGLQEKFAERRLTLWYSPERGQVIWVPMFPTESRSVLWVGRPVDTAPLAALEQVLTIRGAVLVAAVILVVWLLARWIAGRTSRFSRDLTDGIGRMLEGGNVRFAWRGPREFHELGANLTQLADIHARNTRNLRAHARELEESNRYKSEFLANVSHELRTPLNSILLLSKMLAEHEDLPADDLQQTRVINKAALDLRSLIDNILDLSRIEAGEMTISLEEIETRQLLADLAEMLRPQFDAKGLYLRLDIAPDAPSRITADAHKIRQILKNFLSNAVKFTERGGVTLRLRKNSGDDQYRRPVRIEVADTGIGIDPAKQHLIFEAFKQADGATNRRYGGTGLGLSISRSLATLIGGDIALESTPGEGATFILVLPLEFKPGSRPERTPLPDLPPSIDDQPIPEADLSGNRILLVEPDLSQLLRLTPTLERWGLQVMAAADAGEALEVLEEETDCRLVAVSMEPSAADACATIKIIRTSAAGPLRIIAMSAQCGAHAETTECTGLRIPCVSRPGDLNELLAMLRQQIETDKPIEQA